MKKFIGYAFFAYFLECSEGIRISFPFPFPFPFQTLKKERIRGKEVEDALYSKRPTLFNATTNSKCSSGGYPPHLLGSLTLTHTHLLESQVSMLQSMSTPTLLFTTTSTSNEPSHLASASQQTPLTAFHSLSLFCFLGFFCDENCLFITNRETLMNLLKKMDLMDCFRFCLISPF